MSGPIVAGTPKPPPKTLLANATIEECSALIVAESLIGTTPEELFEMQAAPDAVAMVAQPVVKFTPSSPLDSGLTDTLDAVGQIGARAGLAVFGPHLMRVIESHERVGFNGEHVPTLELARCEPAQLPAMLSGHIRFHAKRNSPDGPVWKKSDCPPALATAVVTKAHSIIGITVKRIVHTPILLEDGTLRAEQGYAADLQAWMLSPQVEIGRTDYAAANDALNFLDEWIDEFPFDTEMDRGVTIAAIITAAMRASVDHAPGFAVSKPEFGSGASTLCDLINVVLCGRTAAVTDASVGKIELDKQLDGIVLAALPSIVIDNVLDGSTFKSVSLAQILSQERKEVRALGRSDMTEVPCVQMALVNGNNIKISDDLVRRFMFIKLNPRCESPQTRHFKRPDLIKEAQRDRAQILGACFTIVQAYRESGARVKVEPLAGFEQWARDVAEPLVWLGVTDPILSQKSLEREDPRRILWRAVVHNWHEVFGEKKLRVRDIFSTVSADESYEALHTAIGELCALGTAQRADPSSAFGKQLAAVADRFIDGYQFKDCGADRTGVKCWQLVHTQTDELLR